MLPAAPLVLEAVGLTGRCARAHASGLCAYVLIVRVGGGCEDDHSLAGLELEIRAGGVDLAALRYRRDEAARWPLMSPTRRPRAGESERMRSSSIS